MGTQASATLDCRGMLCPEPMIEMFKKMKTMGAGELLEVVADDALARKNIPEWCKKTGNVLVNTLDSDKLIKFYIKKRG
ncbi:MAG: sulfurtransferase TusA family protein [Armatimonadetes bacterium]|nr:sulfurtransferase TusA family protein [Armatimonadota bacterium]